MFVNVLIRFLKILMLSNIMIRSYECTGHSLLGFGLSTVHTELQQNYCVHPLHTILIESAHGRFPPISNPFYTGFIYYYTFKYVCINVLIEHRY